jgi:hypothetical protein
VSKLFGAVPVHDTGGRGASTTFIQRGIGNVLLTFENEVRLATAEAAPGAVVPVIPSMSILREPPVALVDKIAAKKGTARPPETFGKVAALDPDVRSVHRPAGPAQDEDRRPTRGRSSRSQTPLFPSPDVSQRVQRLAKRIDLVPPGVVSPANAGWARACSEGAAEESKSKLPRGAHHDNPIEFELCIQSDQDRRRPSNGLARGMR